MEACDDIEFVLGMGQQTIWCTSEVTKICKKKNIIKKFPRPSLCAREVSNEILGYTNKNI